MPLSIRARWLIGLLGTIALTTTTLAVAHANSGPTPHESNGGVRVMPLGDSITDGFSSPGGYRIELWKQLTQEGYTVDFVGSQSNGPETLGDHDHEGHSGWRIDQLDAHIVNWVKESNPKTILLHIGTNDIIQDKDVAHAPSRLAALLDHILATAPETRVLVATVAPLHDDRLNARIRDYNAEIPAIVRARAAAGFQVHLVDLYSALTTDDLADGIHPTAQGYSLIATQWYNSLTSFPGCLINT